MEILDIEVKIEFVNSNIMITNLSTHSALHVMYCYCYRMQLLLCVYILIILSYVDSTKTDEVFGNGSQSLSLLQNTQAEMPVYEVASDSMTDTKNVDADLYNTVDGDQTKRLSPNEYETFKSSVS